MQGTKGDLATLLAIKAPQGVIDRQLAESANRKRDRRSLFMSTLIPHTYETFHQLLNRSDYTWQMFVNAWKQEERPFVGDLGFSDDDTSGGPPGSRKYPPPSRNSYSKEDWTELCKLKEALNAQRIERLGTGEAVSLTARQSLIALTGESARLSILDIPKETTDAMGIPMGWETTAAIQRTVKEGLKKAQETAEDSEARRTEFEMRRHATPTASSSTAAPAATAAPRRVELKRNYPPLSETETGNPIDTQSGELPYNQQQRNENNTTNNQRQQQGVKQ